MAKNELDARFAEFGTVSFTSVTQVNDFVGYLEEGKLMGARCKTCGSFFARAHCYQCLAGDMEWFEIAGKGELVSYSTLQYAPPASPKKSLIRSRWWITANIKSWTYR